jgi:hypothetical protein
MNLRIRFLITLFTLAIITLPFHTDGANINDEENIYEAVFLYQFGHNNSISQQKAKAYYLTIGTNNENPSDNFIKRFKSHKPKVLKISEFDRNKNVLIFKITKLQWISATEVEVTGGWKENPLSAAGGTYRVKKRNGKWVVLKYQNQWIS